MCMFLYYWIYKKKMGSIFNKFISVKNWIYLYRTFEDFYKKKIHIKYISDMIFMVLTSPLKKNIFLLYIKILYYVYLFYRYFYFHSYYISDNFSVRDRPYMYIYVCKQELYDTSSLLPFCYPYFVLSFFNFFFLISCIHFLCPSFRVPYLTFPVIE